jgi:hypothetical protein
LKKKLKKAARITFGSLLLLLGFIMIVTPGPALVVVPAGLAVLSSDFAWARLALMKLKKKFKSIRARSKAAKDLGSGSICLGSS